MISALNAGVCRRIPHFARASHEVLDHTGERLILIAIDRLAAKGLSRMQFPRTVLTLVVSLAVAHCSASELKIGDPVGPASLTTLSGERIEMKNYAERLGTAVLFLSGRSDATLRATDEINRLNHKFRERKILFVGVCSNAAESGDEIRTFAQRRGMIFPLYRDPSGDTARRFGARFTPELFLIDRQGTLVFHGGLQDEKALQAYETAVLDLLRKQPIKVATHEVQGTPLGQLGEPIEIDDPYGAISFASELVFDKVPQAAAHHCSTICEAGNHDLLCLWYGGTYESADDQALYLSRRQPGTRNWSEPKAILQNTTTPPGNGVIFRDVGDRLCIVWGRMEGTRPMGRGVGWDRCRLFVRTSIDHGETWSEDRPLFDENLWCVPRNPPIVLKSGVLLLPVEGLQDEVEGSYFLSRVTLDAPWERLAFTDGGSQPAVIQRSDGSLLALMRHAFSITQFNSRDEGKTWTEPAPTRLRNPDSGITMTRLANGHLVLVFNDSQTSRTPLSIVRSLDEGNTWENPLHLESNPGEYSYPCVVQSLDGKIHVTYTFRRYAIKHVELNEAWFFQFERSD